MVFSAKQKMKEEWLLEGHQEGEHEATVRILSRLLTLRFGDSDAERAKATLDAADLDQLLLWSERVPTAESVEEVFR